MEKTIRQQLLDKGFKESPEVYVDRLHEEYKEFESKYNHLETRRKFKMTGMKYKYEMQKRREKINRVCDARGIQNPLKEEETV